MQRINDLSAVFPANTAYLYGYPVGWDPKSRFLNNASTTTEELVAARPLVCAGEHVDVVVFANTVQERILHLLQHELGTVITDRRIVLPKEIDANVTGEDRNKKIQAALRDLVGNKSLVMAQPYIRFT